MPRHDERSRQKSGMQREEAERISDRPKRERGPDFCL